MQDDQCLCNTKVFQGCQNNTKPQKTPFAFTKTDCINLNKWIELASG